MLIFLVMCFATALPMGFTEPAMGPQQMTKNEEMARRYGAAAVAAAAAARNLGIYLPVGKSNENGDENQETVVALPGAYVDGHGNEIYFGNDQEARTFWVFLPAILNAVSGVYKMIRNQRSLDYFDESQENSRDTILDSIGGGHLLKRGPALDSIGGGHLLKRGPVLDPAFGLRSLKRAPAVDSLGGGHLLKRMSALDSIGGGNLLKRIPALDSIGGGNLLKRALILDSIGGGHLLKRDNQFGQVYGVGKKRQVDPLGGGHLLKRFPDYKQLYSPETEDIPDKKPENAL